VAHELLHYDGSDDGVVIRSLRLPRTLLGLAVGAALGPAGALMQALTRNPLADPGVLGVNAGASAIGVLCRHDHCPKLLPVIEQGQVRVELGRAGEQVAATRGQPVLPGVEEGAQRVRPAGVAQ
jgi:hypothetical protein